MAAAQPAVALSGDGELAIYGSADGNVRVWDLEGNLPPRILEGHKHSVMAVALSGDGKRIVSGSVDGTLWIWDFAGKQPPRFFEVQNALIAAALSDDGKHAVSGSGDHTIRVWDLETGGCLAVFNCDAGVLSCVWIGERILVGDDSGQVHLFAWEE